MGFINRESLQPRLVQYSNATLGPGFYERRFKKWGFRKNREGAEWKIIAMKLAERKALGKASVVYCEGKLLSEAKVQKRTYHNSYSMVSMSHNQGNSSVSIKVFILLWVTDNLFSTYTSDPSGIFNSYSDGRKNAYDPN